MLQLVAEIQKNGSLMTRTSFYCNSRQTEVYRTLARLRFTIFHLLFIIQRH
jgi:hypothetical protein